MRGTQEIMEYERLAAQIAPSIYDQLKKTWQREAKALADSLQVGRDHRNRVLSRRKP